MARGRQRGERPPHVERESFASVLEAKGGSEKVETLAVTETPAHPGEVVYTTVADAKTYVDATGIDFLAVSIGTVHGRMKGEPKLDFERLAEINKLEPKYKKM